MTRLAAGGRAAQPGHGDEAVLKAGNGHEYLSNRLLARCCAKPYPPPGILRQHAQRILQLLAEFGAFTDDYPDAEQDAE